MKRILLLSATEVEISPLREFLQTRAVKQTDGSFVWGGLQLDVLITGVGMVAAAASTGIALGGQQYDVVVQAGIAGTFTREASLGAVVRVISEELTELGCDDNGTFISAFDMGLVDQRKSPFYNGRLVPASAALPATWMDLKECRGITVNTVHGEQTSIAKLRKMTNADTESMEGAGCFMAAILAKVPAVQIRSLSNYVEARDRSKWNIPLAVERLNEVLIKGLEEWTTVKN